MKRIALALAMLVAAPAAAIADNNYVSLGIGTTANTSDLGEWEGEGIMGSLFVGHRISYFAFEAGLMRYGMRSDVTGASWSNTALGAAAGLHIPLGPMFGAYGRLGLEKVWTDREEFDGTGWFAGVGAELSLDLGIASGAIFAELTRHATRFVGDRGVRDGNIDMISLGVSVGF